MKPILVFWLAFLLLLCIWIIAGPAATMARARNEQKEGLATLKKKSGMGSLRSAAINCPAKGEVLVSAGPFPPRCCYTR